METDVNVLLIIKKEKKSIRHRLGLHEQSQQSKVQVISAKFSVSMQYFVSEVFFVCLFIYNA